MSTNYMLDRFKNRRLLKKNLKSFKSTPWKKNIYPRFSLIFPFKMVGVTSPKPR